MIVICTSEYSCTRPTPPPLINYIPVTTKDSFLYHTYTKIDRHHSLVYQLRLFHRPDKPEVLGNLEVSNLSGRTICISPASFQLKDHMNLYRLARFVYSQNESPLHSADTCIQAGGSSRISLDFVASTDESSAPANLRLELAMTLEGQPIFSDTLDFIKEN